MRNKYSIGAGCLPEALVDSCSDDVIKLAAVNSAKVQVDVNFRRSLEAVYVSSEILLRKICYHSSSTPIENENQKRKIEELSKNCQAILEY